MFKHQHVRIAVWASSKLSNNGSGNHLRKLITQQHPIKININNDSTERRYSLLRGDKEQEELSKAEKVESIRKRVNAMNKSDEDDGKSNSPLKEKKKDAIQYANKSFTEILAGILRGSIRFFAQNYYLGFGLILTLAIIYSLDVFNLRSETLLSERAKLEEREWK